MDLGNQHIPTSSVSLKNQEQCIPGVFIYISKNIKKWRHWMAELTRLHPKTWRMAEFIQPSHPQPARQAPSRWSVAPVPRLHWYIDPGAHHYSSAQFNWADMCVIVGLCTSPLANVKVRENTLFKYNMCFFLFTRYTWIWNKWMMITVF